MQGHTYKSIYNARKSGFTLHTFSTDYSTLTTDFIGTDSTSMYSFKVTKTSGPSPPSPTPRPAPGGGCCDYGDDSCTAGMTCCSGKGTSYASRATCEEYGKPHGCTWVGGTCIVPALLVENL